MNIFSKWFHRQLTEDPQAVYRDEIDALQTENRSLRQEFAILGREVQEQAENNERRMKKFRAWVQPRKDGKFGPEDAPDGANVQPVILNPTHDQITAQFRLKGLIR